MLLVQGLHTEKPVSIQRALEMKVSECGRHRWKATSWGSVCVAAPPYAQGPVWRTACLEQTVVKFDALIPAKSSVDAAGRHIGLYQEPELEAANEWN